MYLMLLIKHAITVYIKVDRSSYRTIYYRFTITAGILNLKLTNNCLGAMLLQSVQGTPHVLISSTL